MFAEFGSCCRRRPSSSSTPKWMQGNFLYIVGIIAAVVFGLRAITGHRRAAAIDGIMPVTGVR